MRLCPYFWGWSFFLQVTIVTLVPIQKNANETNTASNSSFTDDDGSVLDAQPDETFREEERSKRQSDDTDDEFKPKPSDLIDENASIDSQAFFYPVSNTGIERKPEPASNFLNGRLERIRKPNDEDVQIPLYDDDVDSNDDPLRGILDPKYWEEPNDASLKMDEFFAKLPLASVGGARHVEKESVEKEAKPKYDGDVEICDNTNSNDRMHDDKEMCSGGNNIPNRFLHKQKGSGKNKLKKVFDEDKTRLKEGKKNLNKKKWDPELDEDRTNLNVSPEDNQFQGGFNVSHIHSGLVNNLGSMFDTFMKEVVNGVLKNSSSEDEQSKTARYKAYDDAPQADNISPGQEFSNDKKVLLPASRRRLHMNEDNEDSLAKSPVVRNANITQYNNTLNSTGRRLLSVEVEDNDNQEKADKFSSLMSAGHLDNNASNFLFRSRRRLLSVDENLEDTLYAELIANREHFDQLASSNEEEDKSLDKSPVVRNANITQYNNTLNSTGRRLLSVEVEDNDNQEKADKFSSLMSAGHLDNNASNFLFRSRRRLLSLDENLEAKLYAELIANLEHGDKLASLNKDEDKSLDKSSLREDDKENYFAVDPMDTSKKEQYTNQRYFDILKKVPGVKHLDNKFLNRKFLPNMFENMFYNPRISAPFVRLPRKKWQRDEDELPDPMEPEYISKWRKYREGSKTHTTTAGKFPITMPHHYKATRHTESTTHTPDTATFPTMEDDDEQMNIDVSNKVVEAILAQAEMHPGLRNSLGICRKGELSRMKGSKAPENKLDAMIEEIMKCVGTLIKSHAEKSMCMLLDDNLHDFLQWMLLTGEALHPKGYVAPKPDRDKSAFLFPSICEQPPGIPGQIPPKASNFFDFN